MPDTRSRLLAATAQLNTDELEIVTLIAERLVMGRAQYGALSLATDSRDFDIEAMEEAADMCIYAAAKRIQQRRSNG